MPISSDISYVYCHSILALTTGAAIKPHRFKGTFPNQTAPTSAASGVPSSPVLWTNRLQLQGFPGPAQVQKCARITHRTQEGIILTVLL